MKKLLVLAALCTMVGVASAQESINYSVIGFQTASNGNVEFVEPSTTLLVNITVEQEQIIPGPYARYAQKLLGTRGNLVERTSYYVVDADISLTDQKKELTTVANQQDKTTVISHMGSDTEFAKILPDRLDNSIISMEEAAEQTAAAIFYIRKHRMDLITGEAGENVFGAGLKDALQALDAAEEAYLELFFGKLVVTTTNHRFVVPIQADKQSYELMSFSSVSGVGSVNDEDSNIVVLKVTPSQSSTLKYTSAADDRAKQTANVRVANNSLCEVILNEEAIATAMIPIFEFGTTVKVAR